jgi:hypothetical protein
MVNVVSRSRLPVLRMRMPFSFLLTVPLLFAACSRTPADPNTSRLTAPATEQTPPMSFPSGPTNTAGSAAPTNARYACEYLTAAVGQLSTNDRSINQAVALVQSGADSALAASANDPTYGKLKADSLSFLEDVVRIQVQQDIQQHIGVGAIDASKYPGTYRKTVKEIKADCA